VHSTGITPQSSWLGAIIPNGAADFYGSFLPARAGGLFAANAADALVCSRWSLAFVSRKALAAGSLQKDLRG